MDVFGEASVLFTLLAANTFNDVYNLTGLMSDATRWLLTLIPTAGVLMVIYFVLARNSAQDEHTAAQHTKNMRNVLVGTIIGLGATGLIGVVTHYVDSDGVSIEVTTAASAAISTATAPAVALAPAATASTAAATSAASPPVTPAPAAPATTTAATADGPSAGRVGSMFPERSEVVARDPDVVCRESAAGQGGKVISEPGARCAIQLSSGKVSDASGITITPPWCVELAKRHGGVPSTNNGLGCNVVVIRGTESVYVVRNAQLPETR